jgi:uncharacterized membrane protein
MRSGYAEFRDREEKRCIHEYQDPIIKSILPNLALSCLAALQAPIIMMSQNRQEAKDRLRASHDYQINLKAELEIRQLHQKLDHLLSRQWERWVEIQEVQLELLNEIRVPRTKSD